MQRITGFTREIIDSVHEDRIIDAEVEVRNNLLNKVIYTLQDSLKRLLSDHYLPDLSTLEVLFTDSGDSTCLLHDPIILLNALQYLDGLASHNTATLFKKALDRQRYEVTLNKFNTIIPYAFRFIRNAYSTLSHDVNITSLIIYQTTKTLRAVLNVMMALHIDMLNNDKDATPTPPNNNNNDTNRVRSNTALFETIPSKASILWDNSWGELLKALQPYAQIGTYTATNLMHCADCVVSLLITTSDLSLPWSVVSNPQNSNTNSNSNDDQAEPLAVPTPPRHTPRIFNTLPHELLLAALSLAVICVQQYGVRLGHVGGVSSHILSDNILVQSCDREATIAIDLATTAFAHNILDTQALTILRTAYELSVPRSGGFLLMSAFLKCSLAGCLLVVNWPLGTVEQVDETQLRVFADKQYVFLKRVAEERS
eukprot:gene37897-46763_t